MKTLFLLRHAESSSADSALRDFERPLSDSGYQDACAQGKSFQLSGKSVQCIVCSPAMRAKSTAKVFAKENAYPRDDVTSNPELYFAGVGMLLKAATLMDESCESAMLVGHNPAITEFVNAISNAHIEDIPTAGLVELSLDVDNWADVELGSAKITAQQYLQGGDQPLSNAALSASKK